MEEQERKEKRGTKETREEYAVKRILFVLAMIRERDSGNGGDGKRGEGYAQLPRPRHQASAGKREEISFSLGSDVLLALSHGQCGTWPDSAGWAARARYVGHPCPDAMALQHRGIPIS